VGQKTVLVVEDEPAVRVLLALVLETRDYNVVTTNGATTSPCQEPPVGNSSITPVLRATGRAAGPILRRRPANHTIVAGRLADAGLV
jgi:CheY-like chemotaxis protein